MKGKEKKEKGSAWLTRRFEEKCLFLFFVVVAVDLCHFGWYSRTLDKHSYFIIDNDGTATTKAVEDN